MGFFLFSSFFFVIENKTKCILYYVQTMHTFDIHVDLFPPLEEFGYIIHIWRDATRITRKGPKSFCATHRVENPFAKRPCELKPSKNPYHISLNKRTLILCLAYLSSCNVLWMNKKRKKKNKFDVLDYTFIGGSLRCVNFILDEGFLDGFCVHWIM